MNQSRKKRIGLLLAVILCLSLLPVSALAAGGSTGAVQWSLSGSTLTVKGRGDMPDYSDDAPAPWHDRALSITHVVVEKGVTSVGSLAFYGCEKLRSVALADTVTRIGDRAFKECRMMTGLRLSTGLKSIGNAAFESCESLLAVSLPQSLQRIGDYAFYRCYDLTTITIPASVTDLGRVVFAYCSSLASVQILAEVTEVPAWTFYDCGTLCWLRLPQSVQAVGDSAFYNCGACSNVVYGGTAGDTIASAISSQIGSTVTIEKDSTPPTEDGEMKQPSGGNTATTDENGNLVIRSTEVTDEDDATIRTVTDIVIDKGGKPGGEKNKSEIDASIHDPSGWEKVSDAVSKATEDIGEKSENGVDVKVKIDGTEVSGKDIAKIAGEDVTMEISNENGNRWRIDGNALDKKDVKDKTYDLDYTVSEAEPKSGGIDSDRIFELDVKGDMSLKSSTVAVNLKKENANSYATLFVKKTGGYKEKQTVLIDSNGDAWFSAKELSSGKKYYIGIDVPGIDTNNAVIPHTMYAQYGIDPKYTLTDADGNYYAVGERESSWGITKKQFTLYALLGLGAVVLAVTVAMVTINTVKKSKRKVAAEHGEALPSEETEEEMRIRIMKEMLDESKKNKS